MIRYRGVSFRARVTRVVVPVVVATSLVATGSAGAASAKSFRKAADKICTRTARDLTEYELENVFDGSAAWTVDRGQLFVDLYEEATRKLEKLDPPKKLRATYREFLDANEARISLEEQVVEAAQREDQAAAQALGPEFDENQDLRRELGAELGFGSCAQRLSRAEADDVRETVEETWLNGDPDFCTERYTEGWVTFIGGLEKCEAEERNPVNTPESVEVNEVYGVDKAWASAEITVVGPLAPQGQDLRIDMLYDDGTYKRDNITPIG